MPRVIEIVEWRGILPARLQLARMVALCLVISLAGILGVGTDASAQRSQDGVLTLSDFNDSPIGGLPKAWTWKKEDRDKNKPYEIIEESEGSRYLAADDRGESVILGKQIEWSLEDYPYLEFRWRARSLPPGGDERYGDKNDSAAGLYVTYRKKMGMVPISAKFVWSTTLPVGTATRRSGVGRPFNVVVDSGEQHLNQWRTHVVDLVEIYEKTFGGKPPKNAIGIGVLTDANSVGGLAAADYAYIRALKEGEPTVSVTEVVAAE